MGPVTERRALSVFAAAEIQRSARWSRIGLRQEIGALMGAIAKWLTSTFATGTPKVLFAFDHFNGIRAFLRDIGIRHGLLLIGYAYTWHDSNLLETGFFPPWVELGQIC